MKRLNVKLALWLVGITVFSVVGAHFLHGYQVDRNAEFLKVQAEHAEKEGNLREAIKQYNQYLRHRDDREGYGALAAIVVKVAKEESATRQDKLTAYNILEEAIRRHPDLDDVRKSLVDYTMALRRFGDSLDHIAILRANGKSDPELELKAAQCKYLSGDEEQAKQDLYKLVGFDEATNAFVAEAPASAKEVDSFVLLAHLLRKSGEGTRAEEVLKQMVIWNEGSYEAHLARARDLLGMWTQARPDTPEGKDHKEQLFAESKAELQKAYEQAPDDADVMLLTAASLMLENNLPQAKVVLDKARELHPERPDVYQRLAELAAAQNDLDQAATDLKEGLKKASNKAPLLQQLVEVELQTRKLDDAQATCDEMRKVESIPIEFIRYQEARIKLGRGQIVDATRELEQVRPALERLGAQYVVGVNTLLGRCYEGTGMPDRQLEVYRRILATYPGIATARVGEAAALQALGRHAEAATSVSLLANAIESIDPQLRPNVLQMTLNQEMSKPVEERNWELTNKVAAVLFKDESLPELRKQVLRADLLMAQGKSDEALQLLSALRKENPKDLTVWMGLSRLMTSEEKYRDRIPQLLTLAEKETGDSPALHAERIKIAARMGGEKGSAELQKLEKEMAQYNEAQQAGLMALLATGYLQSGDYENGRRCFKVLLDKEPANARIQQLLFELALEKNDLKGMEESVKGIQELKAFGPESALYKYCAACLELARFNESRKGKTGPLTSAEQDKLAEVRKLAEEGIARRSEWASLWRVMGEIDQIQGDVNGAIEHYQRSLDYSRSNQTFTARRLVTLLYATQRYTEANQAMQYLSGGGELPEDMRRLVEAAKIKGGNAKEALEMAKRDVEKDPTSASSQMWYGQLLESSGDTDAAIAAFQKAIELGPKLTAAWELLVRRLMADGKEKEAVAAVAQASKSLSDNPLIVARLAHRVNDNERAEKLYLEALAKKPDDLMILRLLGEFYVSSNKLDEAQKYLDKIIDLGTSSPAQGAALQVAWARTQKARTVAPSQDYAKTMEAVRLIESNATDGQLSRGDTVTLIELLAPRFNEPPSRAKAIQLLEGLRKEGALVANQMVTLGRLYERDGKWDEAKALMLSAIASDSNNLASLMVFSEMLLEHEEFEDAARYVERCEEIMARSTQPASSPAAQGLRLLRARLLVHDDKKEEAAKLLEGWLPRPLPQAQLFQLLGVAQQMEVLELYEAAEKNFQEYATLDPARGPIALAAFYGRRGDLERSFALLNQARESLPMAEILPVALANLRNFPDKVTPEQFKTLGQWGNEALEHAKDPNQLKLLLAEMYDLQGRYDDVVKIYRELLANPEASTVQKAIVQNNLAFVLAAVNPTPARGAESLKLIEEAIQILGPTSDLLDTRALAYLAQGKVEQAAADLRSAVGDQPSTSKYYHLAQVEKRLGNEEAARAAIEKAQELHGEHNPFTPAEREGYKRLMNELNLSQAGT